MGPPAKSPLHPPPSEGHGLHRDKPVPPPRPPAAGSGSGSPGREGGEQALTCPCALGAGVPGVGGGACCWGTMREGSADPAPQAPAPHLPPVPLAHPQEGPPAQLGGEGGNCGRWGRGRPRGEMGFLSCDLPCGVTVPPGVKGAGLPPGARGPGCWAGVGVGQQPQWRLPLAPSCGWDSSHASPFGVGTTDRRQRGVPTHSDPGAAGHWVLGTGTASPWKPAHGDRVAPGEEGGPGPQPGFGPEGPVSPFGCRAEAWPACCLGRRVSPGWSLPAGLSLHFCTVKAQT